MGSTQPVWLSLVIGEKTSAGGMHVGPAPAMPLAPAAPPAPASAAPPPPPAAPLLPAPAPLAPAPLAPLLGSGDELPHAVTSNTKLAPIAVWQSAIEYP